MVYIHKSLCGCVFSHKKPARSEWKKVCAVTPTDDVGRSKNPLFLIVCGLPGSGKSTVSRALIGDIPAVYVSVDNIRKALFKNVILFDTQQTHTTYYLMYLRIQDLLEQGYCVILEGIYGKKIYRREIIAQFSDEADIRILEIHTKKSMLLQRLRLRQRDHSNPLMITWEGNEALLVRSMTEYEPPNAEEGVPVLRYYNVRSGIPDTRVIRKWLEEYKMN